MGKDYLHIQFAKKDWTGKALKYAIRANSDHSRQHKRIQGIKDKAYKKEYEEEIRKSEEVIRIYGSFEPSVLEEMEEMRLESEEEFKEDYYDEGYDYDWEEQD